MIIKESDSDYEVPAKRQARRLSPIKPEETVEVDPIIRKDVLKNSEKNVEYVRKIASKRKKY